MGYIVKEGYRFRITETGHINTRYYLNKAHLERARAAITVVNYARDKFMGALSSAISLLKSKAYTKSVRD